LITQGSFVGVLIGPPVFFWIRQQGPASVAVLALLLAILMMISLLANAPVKRAEVGEALPAADSQLTN
jgi:hypothetical protein